MKDATLLIAGLAFLLLSKKKKGWKSPVKGVVTSDFGNRIHPITFKKSFHNGIDIAVPLNTPVKAPADGVVSYNGTTESGGRQLVLAHAGGYLTGYAHLNQRLVGKGAKVKKGQTIAKSGRTGNVTGYHLHFSFRKNGKYLDPQKYFDF